MKKKNEGHVSGILVKTREPDEKPESEDDKDDPSAAIHACAQDLVSAINANDVKAVAEAIQAAFEILDSMPHEEGPHVEPHSYAAQNEQAGEE
jgi:hypothetical protein